MHMLSFDDGDTIDICDDAADTLRFARADLDFDGATDPDATSIWDLRSELAHEEQSLYALDAANVAVNARYIGKSRRSAARRRLIRDTQQEIAGLHEAIAAGWDVGPELVHQKRRLAQLVAADRKAS
jgi:hypothetical protein